jgi:hypothetical protein
MHMSTRTCAANKRCNMNSVADCLPRAGSRIADGYNITSGQRALHAVVSGLTLMTNAALALDVSAAFRLLLAILALVSSSFERLEKNTGHDFISPIECAFPRLAEQ